MKGKTSKVTNINSRQKKRQKKKVRMSMPLTEITATKEVEGKGKLTATIAKDLGETAAQAIEMFGAEVVHSNFKSAARITAQAAMRRYLEAGKNQEEVAALMENWKPGVAIDRVIDPVAALVGRWDSYTPQEQADILAKLKKK